MTRHELLVEPPITVATGVMLFEARRQRPAARR